MFVYILARAGDKIELFERKTNVSIKTADYREHLSEFEWSQCRDGLIIYKTIKIQNGEQNDNNR